MKRSIIKIAAIALISSGLLSIPASANTWFSYDDCDGNRITWGMHDDNGNFKQGWYYENGYWYYFGGQGLACTGLITIDGNDYYFDRVNCDMKHDQYVKVENGRDGAYAWANSDGSIDYTNCTFYDLDTETFENKMAR